MVSEYDIPVNVDAMNAEFIARSQEVWDAVEKDRWIYNLENDDGIAPNFNKKRKQRSNTIKSRVNNLKTNGNQSNEYDLANVSEAKLSDDGFGNIPTSVNVINDEIPNLMDIPESELQ